MTRLRSLKKHKKQEQIASREGMSTWEKRHTFHRNIGTRWAEMPGVGIETGE